MTGYDQNDRGQLTDLLQHFKGSFDKVCSDWGRCRGGSWRSFVWNWMDLSNFCSCVQAARVCERRFSGRPFVVVFLTTLLRLELLYIMVP